jgi:O-antigen ligase
MSDQPATDGAGGGRMSVRAARLARERDIRDELIRTAQPLGSVATVAMLMFCGLALLGPLLSNTPGGSSGEGSVVRQAGYLVTFALALYAVRTNLALARAMVLPRSLLIVLIWFWASLFWAIEPGVAARRLVLTTMVIWTIFLLVEALGHQRIAHLLRTALVAILCVNFITAIVFPSIGTHLTGEVNDPGLIGNWRGVLVQKNFAGAVCAVTVLLFLFDARARNPLWRATVMAAALLFLYKTQSKTSVALVAMVIVAGYLFILCRPRYRFVLLLLSALAIIPGILAVDTIWDDLIDPLSRQDALTGRVQIWPVLLRFWNEHWLTGVGYGSFWNIGSNSPIHFLTRGWVARIGNGHNGYIDLLLQVGLIGTVMTILAVIIYPLIGLVLGRAAGTHRAALPFTIILFAAGHNMTETSLMERDMIVHVLLMFAVAMAHAINAPSPVPVEPRSSGPDDQ